MASFTRSFTIVPRLLAFLTPVYLSFYWVVWITDRPVAILLFRPLMVATSGALMLLLWHRVTVTRAEKEFALVLGRLCLVLLAPSLAAGNPVRALLEWVKLLILCAVSLMMCRALRHPSTAKTFGASLIVGSVVLGILIVATYVRYMGVVVPTYGATRIYKGAMLKAQISLNSIAFDCVFAYVCGMCLVRSRKYLWFLGGVLLAISATLTGSRTPLAVFVVSGLALLAINTLRSRRLLVWLTGMVLLASLTLGVAFTVRLANSRELSHITEGRWDLWSVALRKFSERPLLGYGYQSVRDDPTFVRGGYHNEYVTAAAEQGVVGLTPVLYLFWFALRSSWKLAFRRSYTWRNGQWALLACFLLLLHQTVELGGLFGAAQAPGDFLANIFVALVVSRFSREEDFLASWCRQPAAAPSQTVQQRVLRNSMHTALS